jgi:hypothetical protein
MCCLKKRKFLYVIEICKKHIYNSLSLENILKQIYNHNVLIKMLTSENSCKDLILENDQKIYFSKIHGCSDTKENPNTGPAIESTNVNFANSVVQLQNINKLDFTNPK